MKLFQLGLPKLIDAIGICINVSNCIQISMKSMHIRDEQSHIFQTPTSLLLNALRLLLRQILKHQLRLLLTL